MILRELNALVEHMPQHFTKLVRDTEDCFLPLSMKLPLLQLQVDDQTRWLKKAKKYWKSNKILARVARVVSRGVKTSPFGRKIWTLM